eukprot:GCRY01000897.1.p1 GENE.GCRY01000897.1~~GCRY01000897.1.p1  ORF type:complete len:214 (-),score=54.84 GCRY01000897.1:422-1063(-)
MKLFGKAKSAPPPQDGMKKLRDTLETLEKRERYIEKKIDVEVKTAKSKAQKDKRGALMALRRKKQYEQQRDKIGAAKINLERQLMAIEDASINKQTLDAMKVGATTLKTMHGEMSIEQVDNIVDDIQSEMDTAQMISEAISQPIGGDMLDEDDLLAELEDLEQESVDEAFLSVPATASPAASDTLPAFPEVATHDATAEEEAQLKELEASLAF